MKLITALIYSSSVAQTILLQTRHGITHQFRGGQVLHIFFIENCDYVLILDWMCYNLTSLRNDLSLQFPILCSLARPGGNNRWARLTALILHMSLNPRLHHCAVTTAPVLWAALSHSHYIRYNITFNTKFTSNYFNKGVYIFQIRKRLTLSYVIFVYIQTWLHLQILFLISKTVLKH